VSHDPLEIILICWFVAMYYYCWCSVIIFRFENRLLLYFCGKHDHFCSLGLFNEEKVQENSM